VEAFPLPGHLHAQRKVDEQMCKALVVDDSKAIRMILCRILAQEGYPVYEAASAKDALEVMKAERGSIGLVLIDWNMPGINGLELLKQLRLCPECGVPKVIIVSTEAELGHMASALEAGADEYVMKPFTKDILREKLALIGALPSASV
jgi:two-component system chemotaxis response regulator CheY